MLFFFYFLKETKRAYLKPSKVENLLVAYWENGGVVRENLDTIYQIKERVRSQLHHLRNDHKRMLNPTPYKVIFCVFIYSILYSFGKVPEIPMNSFQTVM